MSKEHKLRTLATINARHFSVDLDEVELRSGRKSERIIMNHPDAAALIPIIDDDRILFVRQYRYAIEKQTLEIPAGKLDPGEDPETCIKREFEEETGYTVKDLQLLIKYFPAVGYSSEVIYIYTGTNINQKTERIMSSDEISEVVSLNFDEIKQYIQNGEIIDGKTLLALYVYMKGKI